MTDNEKGKPKYIISESKLEEGIMVELFDLDHEDLIYEKMVLIFEKKNPAEKKLHNAKKELEKVKDKLLLETDFKKVLGESRLTVAMKESYIHKHIAEYEDAVDNAKEEIDYYKSKIVIVNDLIEKAKLDSKMEYNLMKED